MMLKEILSKIETREFEANLVVASGLMLFKLVLDDHPDVEKLVSILRVTAEVRLVLLEHLFTLLEEEPEAGFVHPNDIFIATYLWTLSRTNSDLALYATRHVMQTPQLRWARIMAKEVERVAVQLTRAYITTASEDALTVNVDLVIEDQAPETHVSLRQHESTGRSSGSEEYTIKSESLYPRMPVEMVAS